MNRVLLLNADYEPLSICTIRKAVNLMLKGKAEPLHFLEDNYLNTVGEENIIRPTVLRLNYQIKRKYTREYKVSRLGIYNRDNHTCQYCGVKNNELTLDHVYPRHLGGPHTWENLVTCCKRCNGHKAWKTLDQANMKLLSKPKCPKYSFHAMMNNFAKNDFDEWNFYIV